MADAHVPAVVRAGFGGFPELGDGDAFRQNSTLASRSASRRSDGPPGAESSRGLGRAAESAVGNARRESPRKFIGGADESSDCLYHAVARRNATAGCGPAD